MNAINPKQDFQDHGGPYVEEARKQLPQVWFRQAANAALAQMAHDGSTEDELKGARTYLGLLINIAEKPVMPERMPVSRLETLG